MKKTFASFIALIMIFALAVTSVSAVAVVGDFNENGIVTADDAIYLLYYCQFGKTEYYLNQSGDMNNDGVVNPDDAIYLLYCSVFGETLYPLPEDKDQGFGPWVPIM